MDDRLEVIGLPVSDVDAAIAFYVDQVGFHLDHDIEGAPGMRVVQLTPPGSPCSVVFGTGMPLGALLPLRTGDPNASTSSIGVPRAGAHPSVGRQSGRPTAPPATRLGAA